jgi:hypothetical protein
MLKPIEVSSDNDDVEGRITSWLCVVKTLLMFEINGLQCEPYVAKGTVAAC